MSWRKLRRTSYETLDCEDVAGMERSHPASEILIVDGVYAPVNERGLVIEAGYLQCLILYPSSLNVDVIGMVSKMRTSPPPMTMAGCHFQWSGRSSK